MKVLSYIYAEIYDNHYDLTKSSQWPMLLDVIMEEDLCECSDNWQQLYQNSVV